MFVTKENLVDPEPQRNLFHAYKKLIRPTVVSMGLTNALVGIFYAGLSYDSLVYAIIALLSIAAIVAFSYGYNQLTDLDEDRINAPHRPLVTGELSVAECKVLLGALLALSIIPLLIFGRYLAFLLMLVGPVFSGVSYSKWRVKSTLIKPFFVAYGWSFVPIIAYTAVTNELSNIFLILIPFFLILMFLTTTMGDLRDVDGDKASNVRTLPVVFGTNSVVKSLQIYTIMNYSVLIVAIILNILPADALLGVIGGILLLRYVRTTDVLSRQKGIKKSLARFSWVTSIGLVAGRIIAFFFGIIF